MLTDWLGRPSTSRVSRTLEIFSRSSTVYRGVGIYVPTSQKCVWIKIALNIEIITGIIRTWTSSPPCFCTILVVATFDALHCSTLSIAVVFCWFFHLLQRIPKAIIFPWVSLRRQCYAAYYLILLMSPILLLVICPAHALIHQSSGGDGGWYGNRLFECLLWLYHARLVHPSIHFTCLGLPHPSLGPTWDTLHVLGIWRVNSV
jgi:hypothetical protein